MPLSIISTVLSNYYLTHYYTQIGALLVAIFVAHAYAQGRTTNRERNLHGRVILLTGGFTSTGMTLMEALARRGAHIIALTQHPIETPQVALPVEALRESVKNDKIFAEQCDLLSLESVRAFCTKFLTGNEHRLDVIVFAHEYEHIGSLFASKDEKAACEEARAAASDGSFLMTTLLLPTILVAPAERDIRIINVVNPFYAAAAPFFPNAPPIHGSQFAREGYRALRTIVLTRHLQRVFDALPSAPALDPDRASAAMASNKVQKSNIVAVSVSPGFSRHDTIAPLLRAQFTSPEFSRFGLLAYIALQPLFRIFTKSPSHAIQSIIHVLFLPTPFKRAQMHVAPVKEQDIDNLPEEVLKPGSLYSDCSTVRVQLRGRNNASDAQEKVHPPGNGPPDDGELGGEELGRIVWESFETSLKHREKLHASREGAAPSRTTPLAAAEKKDN